MCNPKGPKEYLAYRPNNASIMGKLETRYWALEQKIPNYEHTHLFEIGSF